MCSKRVTEEALPIKKVLLLSDRFKSYLKLQDQYSGVIGQEVEIKK